MAEELELLVGENEARVNVTYAGQNGELPDPVFYDSTDGDVKAWVTEAVQNGGIPGIPATADADFSDFVVDRFPPTEARPYNLIQVRPKTAYGNRETMRCGIAEGEEVKTLSIGDKKVQLTLSLQEGTMGAPVAFLEIVEL